MRHSRGYSRSAEQQSHITRALCTGSARGRVRTCMEVPDPGRASRRGHTHPVFHESLCDPPGRDPFASGAVASPRRSVVYRVFTGKRRIEFSTFYSLDCLTDSGDLGRGRSAKAGPLGVPSRKISGVGKGLKKVHALRRLATLALLAAASTPGAPRHVT